MPQLDKVTYISQLFWLILVFISLYLYVLKSILPSINRILRVRKKKIDENNKQISLLKDEEFNVVKEYENILMNSLNESKQSFNKTIQTTLNWLKLSLKNINKDALLSINRDYIKTIGDISGKKYLIKKCINKN